MREWGGWLGFTHRHTSDPKRCGPSRAIRSTNFGVHDRFVVYECTGIYCTKAKVYLYINNSGFFMASFKIKPNVWYTLYIYSYV